ncbi:MULTISPECIES: glycosyltransferase family 39 protein [unclassified Pseudofrankia]|uniref:glycosyltransferase family 39 protein n=1 Tax=unclassified Pseudofrankia TaxID=2994372 RepID=UPI0008DA6B14|nr:MULTISPECIES: glycosyltransferase family 39 protein [unclassified Pseudofrankia]MDT3444639.1 glycosyltransferase family 39 protein [Pseudofrankia sp. BMG5.37]OHV47415.1 hypothetical protein BCD48_18840 [Pseudofrankia sp. BMG5.36]
MTATEPDRVQTVGSIRDRRRWRPRLVVDARLGLAAGLVAVLAVQAAISLSLSATGLSATAFEDEALYLHAGRQILNSWIHGGPGYDDFASYFSGSPYIYPPLGALADGAGGLAGARLLSLVFALVTTVLVATVGRSLFNRAAGVAGAAAFVCGGPVLFLGGFATYDAMALMLLVGGLAVGLRAAAAERTRTALLLASVAGILLGGAVATKYMVALFVPSICLIVLTMTVRTSRSPSDRGAEASGTPFPAPRPPAARASATGSHRRPTRRARGREFRLSVRLAGLALGGTVGAAAVAGVWLGLTGTRQLSGMMMTTISRTPFVTTGRLDVFEHGLRWAAPTLLVAVLAVPLVGRQRPALTGLLLITSLLPIIFQARSGELTSLHKHVAFGLAFAAPLAGAGLASAVTWLSARNSGRMLKPGILLASAAGLVLLYSGARTAHDLFGQWADSRPLVAFLRTQVGNPSDHYLVEESEVPRYYLEDRTASGQWDNTYYLYYVDPRTKAAIPGVGAYRAALTDRYFEIVVLRYGPTAALDRQIRDILDDTTRYRQIAQVPDASGWTIWRRVAP